MFRFSIRDVLWLTVVVALSVGWWLDRSAKDRRIEVLEKKLYEMHIIRAMPEPARGHYDPTYPHTENEFNR